MDIGMLLPRLNAGNASLTREFFFAAAERLEDNGFSSAWLTDSIGRGYPNPEPLIALTALAASGSRLRLGTSILQLGIRNPALLARELMTSYLIAGDQLNIGVGAGSTEKDFNAAGCDYHDRFKKFERSLTVVRGLLRGETIDGTTLSPFDATIGGPKILIGSWAGSKWIPRAADEFDGWIASARHSTWTSIEEGIRRYRDAGGQRAVITNLIVDPSIEDAPADHGDTRLEACGKQIGRQRIRRLRELGFDEVVLRTWDHTDDIVGQIAEIAL